MRKYWQTLVKSFNLRSSHVGKYLWYSFIQHIKKVLEAKPVRATLSLVDKTCMKYVHYITNWTLKQLIRSCDKKINVMKRETQLRMNVHEDEIKSNENENFKTQKRVNEKLISITTRTLLTIQIIFVLREWQKTNLPSWHVLPLYPFRHKQWKLFPTSWQVPPLLHGFTSQLEFSKQIQTQPCLLEWSGFIGCFSRLRIF